MIHTYIDKFKHITIITLLHFALAGCTDGGSLRTSSSIIGEGWASPPEPYDPPALYCYSTLGAPDCHAIPLANAQTRIKGSYAGPPALPLENNDDQSVDVEYIPVSDSIESTTVYQDYKVVHQAPIPENHTKINKSHRCDHWRQPVSIHHRKHQTQKTIAQQPLSPAVR